MIERLSRQELRTVTGASVRARQIEWLTAHGWPHEIDYLGYPVVLRSLALERLGGTPPAEVWRLDESNVA